MNINTDPIPLEELATFLRFKSISSEPEFKKEMLSCAKWVENFLIEAGLRAEVWETPGHPSVFGQSVFNKDSPTVLFYLHYDVQPVDPLELWESDPFEATVRNGEVYARGACDNKGQCFYTLCAIKKFLKAGNTGVNIKVIIEGEEEMGSSGLSKILESKAEALQADYLIVVDSGIPAMDTPRVTIGVRGIVTFDVQATAANMDLHSGQMGGIALNPVTELAKLFAKLWDDEGHIAIPGIYDDVIELSEEFLREVDLSIDEEGYKKSFALKGFFHEEGYSLGEGGTVRPCLEVNGFAGGYAGEGFKTIIPAKARAKLSCRIVQNQDPKKIAQIIADFLQKNAKEGIDVKIEMDHGGLPAMGNPKSPIARIIKKAYEELFGLPCKFMIMGGSIPIAASLAKTARAELILMGMVLPDDAMHAPNEHFGVKRMKMGYDIVLRSLEMLQSGENV